MRSDCCDAPVTAGRIEEEANIDVYFVCSKCFKQCNIKDKGDNDERE